MREHKCWIPLAVAATLMGGLAVPAQDWETVDDFAPAGANAEAHGVAVDAAGRIYVVGTANGHGIVRRSIDSGMNWTTQDDFVYPAEPNTRFNAVIVDSSGAVFVGGAAGSSWLGHWLVRRTTDQGVTWQTVDDFFVPRNGPVEGTNGAVFSLSSDGQGRVYGAGTFLPTGPSYPSWWVRGSGVGGTNWDTKLLLFSGYDQVSQITCAGQDVYVTGAVSDGSSANWLIVGSTDLGATWTTNSGDIGYVHWALTADSAGYLYTAGATFNNSTSVVWLVRQAAPGGTNWTTLDRSLYDEGDSSGRIDQPLANAITVDAGGNVCATGEFINYWVKNATNGTTYGSDTTWFTRQYQAASGQWSTTDLFSYSTNRQGAALGAAIAPSGTAFVAGYGTSDSGQQRWVVRRRGAAPNPPRLRIFATTTNTVILAWPASAIGYVLEQRLQPGGSGWTAADVSPVVANGENQVIISQTPGRMCYRLRRL